MGFLGIRIGEGINRCKRKCESWYPGAPDLVAGCKSACKQEPRGLTKCKYLENYVGDQTSISKYGIDCDTSKGIGSELVKKQEEEKAYLLGLQQYIAADSQYRANQENKLRQTVIALDLAKKQEAAQGESKNKQLTNLVLFLLIAGVIYFLATKFLKNGG